MGCSSSSSGAAGPVKSIDAAQRARIDAILNYWFQPGWDRDSDPGKNPELWFGYELTAE